METSTPLQIGQHETFGPFELVERIGLGGMATVHRAVQRGTEGFARELVVKRILPQLADDAQFVRMFIDEAKIGAYLTHPNIVQIYDLGQIDTSYFMAMEYVEGVSLLEIMRHYSVRQMLDPLVVAYIVMQVCIGLDYAHNLTINGHPVGIVHRDVSPANVMVSRRGDVKLLDFGIAKAAAVIEREETRVGTLKGKLSYMSPEQVEGAPVTALSDIFVTGVLLWELLAGRRLFRTPNDYDTLRNVMHADVPPLTEIRDDLPEALVEICNKALSKCPTDRFRSAEQMADAIEQRVLPHAQVCPSDLVQIVSPVILSRPWTRNATGSNPSHNSSSNVSSSARKDASQSNAGIRCLPSRGSASSVACVQRIQPPKTRRWLWTLAAFAGGAIAAIAVIIAIMFFTGSLPSRFWRTSDGSAAQSAFGSNAPYVVVGVRDGMTHKWTDQEGNL